MNIWRILWDLDVLGPAADVYVTDHQSRNVLFCSWDPLVGPKPASYVVYVCRLHVHVSTLMCACMWYFCVGVCTCCVVSVCGEMHFYLRAHLFVWVAVQYACVTPCVCLYALGCESQCSMCCKYHGFSTCVFMYSVKHCACVCKCARTSAEVWCGSRADLVRADFGSALKENKKRWMEWLIHVCQVCYSDFTLLISVSTTLHVFVKASRNM